MCSRYSTTPPTDSFPPGDSPLQEEPLLDALRRACAALEAVLSEHAAHTELAAVRRAPFSEEKMARILGVAKQILSADASATEPLAPKSRTDVVYAVRQKICERAYQLWEQRGKPLWDDHTDWFQAVSELCGAASRQI